MDRIAQSIVNFMKNDLPEIVAAEGLSFIKKNFRDQGFNDNGLRKWAARKTRNKRGKDLMYYRSDRRGKAGGLTRFGRRNINRAILTGFGTGGNKLRNSFRATTTAKEVKFITDKEYGEAHNEGTKLLPKRQFIGKSAYLEKKINSKITRTLNNIFRQNG